jgi:membrane protein
VVALALIMLLFSVLYSFAINRPRLHWRWVSPGSIIGTTIWAIISVAFSFYTSSFGSYTKTYGALAGVAILIFWLYLTGFAILVGGEMNAAFERTGMDASRSSHPRGEHLTEG